MRDDFRIHRMVIAVADAGSLTAAAARLGAETSAISRGVRDLETQLGVSLFERLPRGVELTVAGSEYVAFARDMMQRLRRAENAARLAREGSSGGIRIGYICSFTSGPIVELLGQFRSKYPEVVLQLHELSKAMVETDVDDLDLMITHTGAGTSESPDRRRLPVWTARLGVAIPMDDPTEAVAWTDLEGPVLLCRPSDGWWLTASGLDSAFVRRLRLLPQDVSREGLLGLVAAGCGWAIVPDYFGELEVKGVRVVALSPAVAPLELEAIWKASNDNPALTRFLALAREMYGQACEDRSTAATLQSPGRSP